MLPIPRMDELAALRLVLFRCRMDELRLRRPCRPGRRTEWPSNVDLVASELNALEGPRQKGGSGKESATALQLPSSEWTVVWNEKRLICRRAWGLLALPTRRGEGVFPT